MACGTCPSTLPPVSSDYKPKGSYESIADMKTYFTGPSDAKAAILLVYDVFGLHPNSLQGADRLARETNQLVVVPDLFKGKALPLDVHPPDTDEKQKIIKAFQPLMDPSLHIPSVKQVVDEVTTKRGIISWGSFGLCFGGMITAMMSAEGTSFKASGTAHPGRPSPAQAQAIVIPYLCLFSKEDGEPATVEEYGNILKGKKGCIVEHYPNMHHGWMGARSRLDDEANVQEFKRGWSQVAEFFSRLL